MKYEPTEEKIIVPYGLYLKVNGKRYSAGQKLPKGSVVTWTSDEKLASGVGIKKKPTTKPSDKGGE